MKRRMPRTKSASKTPHPVDDLAKAEPKLDAKLESLDPRKLKKLRRIAQLERDFCGDETW